MQHAGAAVFVDDAASIDADVRPVMMMMPLLMVLPPMLLLPGASLTSCCNVFSELQATGNCRRRCPILAGKEVLCR